MRILLLFAFLPPLLLNSLLSSASQTTYGFITPEFTDLMVTGPFIVKIVESQTKPVQITVNSADDINAVSVQIFGNTVEIEPNATDRRSIHMQINVSSKLLKNIKAFSGAQIVSNWKDFRINSITLMDNATVNFTNITSQDLTINASFSSRVHIGNINAPRASLRATQKTSISVDAGIIDILNATAFANSSIQAYVKTKKANIQKNSGGSIITSRNQKDLINVQPLKPESERRSATLSPIFNTMKSEVISMGSDFKKNSGSYFYQTGNKDLINGQLQKLRSEREFTNQAPGSPIIGVNRKWI